jgi:hypothetical protein
VWSLSPGSLITLIHYNGDLHDERLCSLLLIFGFLSTALADFTPETIKENVLPDHCGKQWFWVSGPGLRNSCGNFVTVVAVLTPMMPTAP